MWLVERNSADQALGWLRSLPANFQTNAPDATFIAECEVLTHDWSGLRNSASKQDWGDSEFTRHAFLARALREQSLYGASKTEWDLALKDANGRDGALAQLFRFAAKWGWPDESQQILWTIVKTYPQEQWAYQDLTGQLYGTGSTRSLMQLFGIQSSRNPADSDAKNNLALTAMLLRANELKPYDLAQQVYQKCPTNADYACTYAFSLYLQGKSAEALKVMQQIAPQKFEGNSAAGYYGLVLKSAGDRAKAQAYLKRSTTGQLLPEERSLFQEAMSGL